MAETALILATDERLIVVVDEGEEALVEVFNMGIAGPGGVDQHVENIGNGTDTVYTVTHGLNNFNTTVEVIRNDDNSTRIADVDRPTADTVRVTFREPVLLNQYRVVIQGRSQ